MSDKFSRGFIVLSRDLLDSSLWNLPPDHFRVAVYLMLKARHSDREHTLPDGTKIGQGELVTSMMSIAENCEFYENRTTREYSRKKVLNILKNLENIGFILRNSHSKGTHISVCNYSTYQDIEKYNSHSSETVKEHQGNTEGTTLPTNNNDKKENNENNESKKAIASGVAEFYNLNRGCMAKCQAVTKQRISAINARISEYGLDAVNGVIMTASESDFLQGKTKAEFSCGIDWIMGPQNFLKILEGNYKTKSSDRSGASGIDLVKELFDAKK